ELETRTDDPAFAFRVEAIVVVLVQLAQCIGFGRWVELDHTHSPVSSSDRVDVPAQGRRDLAVRRPDAVLVRLAVIPEAGAPHLPHRRRQGREVGVATRLPVDIFESLPL